MDEVEDCAGWMTAPGLTDSNTVIYIYIIYIYYTARGRAVVVRTTVQSRKILPMSEGTTKT